MNALKRQRKAILFRDILSRKEYLFPAWKTINSNGKRVAKRMTLHHWSEVLEHAKRLGLAGEGTTTQHMRKCVVHNQFRITRNKYENISRSDYGGKQLDDLDEIVLEIFGRTANDPSTDTAQNCTLEPPANSQEKSPKTAQPEPVQDGILSTSHTTSKNIGAPVGAWPSEEYIVLDIQSPPNKNLNVEALGEPIFLSESGPAAFASPGDGQQCPRTSTPIAESSRTPTDGGERSGVASAEREGRPGELREADGNPGPGVPSSGGEGTSTLTSQQGGVGRNDLKGALNKDAVTSQCSGPSAACEDAPDAAPRTVFDPTPGERDGYERQYRALMAVPPARRSPAEWELAKLHAECRFMEAAAGLLEGRQGAAPRAPVTLSFQF